MLLHITVKPGASRNEVLVEGDDIRIRVAAPASEGKANAELERFLAKRLRVPRTGVTVMRGHAARHKVVSVTGLDRETVLARLNEGA